MKINNRNILNPWGAAKECLEIYCLECIQEKKKDLNASTYGSISRNYNNNNNNNNKNNKLSKLVQNK